MSLTLQQYLSAQNKTFLTKNEAFPATVRPYNANDLTNGGSCLTHAWTKLSERDKFHRKQADMDTLTATNNSI